MASTLSQRIADREYERRALSDSIAAEITSYIDLMTRRDHQTHVRELIASLRSGQPHSLKDFGNAMAGIPVKEAFPIFFSQLDKVGLLGNDAYELGRFYTGVAGVIASLHQMAAGKFESLPLDARATLLEEELKLWNGTINIGRNTAARLRQQ